MLCCLMDPGLIPFEPSALIQIHLLRIHVCVHWGGGCPRFDDTAGEQGLSQTPMGPTPDMGQTGVYICICVGHKQSHQQWVISPTADMGQTGDCNSVMRPQLCEQCVSEF